MDEFASIRTFVEVANAGSFSECSRRKNISVSSVARQVTALESELGVRLVNRNTRRQSLTDAGTAFYHRVVDVLSELDLARQSASAYQTSLKGTLRVSIRPSAGELILPAMPAFLKSHKDISLNITLDDHRLDLIKNNVDVAVWLGHLADSSLVARRLTVSRRVLVGSPSYFAKYGIPLMPEDLKEHNCIVFNSPSYDSSWKFQKGSEQYRVKVSGNISSTSGPVIKAMALNGTGLVVVQEFMVRTAIEDGSLQAVLTDFEVSPTDADTALYAVYPHRERLPLKARVFLDFLIELFGYHGKHQMDVSAIPASASKPTASPKVARSQ
jgi:DNA-binding transcriptional LysR family regulator